MQLTSFVLVKRIKERKTRANTQSILIEIVKIEVLFFFSKFSYDSDKNNIN